MDRVSPEVAMAGPLRGLERQAWASPAAGSSLRMPQPGGWLHFEVGWLRRWQAVRNLETMVSLLQTAQQTLAQVDQLVSQALLRTNLAWRDEDRFQAPPPSLQQMLAALVRRLDELARACRFHGRGLLDGQSGVAGLGLGVVFVRGGPNTATSPPPGYAVRVTGFPARAALTGGVMLHEDWLRAEQEILLVEGDNHIRFAPEPGEGVPEFLTRLQEAVLAAGLDLDIGVTGQRRLVVQHNQYGSQFKFKGCSRKTPLLSKRPGKLEWSRPGRDIQGTLEGEPAFGIGRMLVGYLDNARTSELAVLWRGGPLSAEHTAQVHVVQNGLVFQEGEDLHRPLTRLNLPSLCPRDLAGWMEPRSGFSCLAEVRAGTWQEVRDTLNLLFAVSSELEDWKEKLDGWIRRYQAQALHVLRQGEGTQDAPLLNAQQQREAERMAQTLRDVMRGEPERVREVLVRGA